MRLIDMLMGQASEDVSPAPEDLRSRVRAAMQGGQDEDADEDDSPLDLRARIRAAMRGEGTADDADEDGLLPSEVAARKQAALAAERRRATRQVAAAEKARRAPSEVSVREETLAEKLERLHAERRRQYNAENPGSIEQIGQQDLVILGRMEVLNQQAKNKCPTYVLYQFDGTFVKCPKCKGSMSPSDMREISGYRTSYPEFDSCPFCVGLLDRDATPEARLAARERCEANPQRDEETGQIISCEGKGYLMRWMPAWAYHTCTACTNEIRAGGKGGRGRSVKYT